ncbi:Trk system potassium uptake protein TrkA [Phocaeicola vulgatus]|uniref:Trk system potassium uptake protein TrkA n=1 Tax=Phocaeicola vulgatus TaxID=821 RepID=A0A0P0LH22_PHOVU|nr:Trk system potassium uptake protein TrkA [Phocaeicola vulgatus]
MIKGEKVLNGLGISILEHQVENHFEENYGRRKISWSAIL